MQQTAIIVESTSGAPLHLRHDPALGATFVSSRSRWHDERWVLDNPTRGSRANGSTINWRIQLDGDRCFTDPDHATLLDTMKRVAWSLMAAPREGAAPLAPASYSGFSAGMAVFVRWMVRFGFRAISELDGPVLDHFKEDLPGILAGSDGEGSDEEISHAVALRALIIPMRLWQQRRELERAGIRPLPEEPWGGESAGSLANDIATKAAGQIMPLPDEVAIPIMNAAHRMIGVPADDVIALSRAYLDGFETGTPGGRGRGPGFSEASRVKAGRRAIQNFVFASISGEDRPWHGPIVREIRETLWSKASNIYWVQGVRQLILDVRNAAVIVIQSTTGMRVSEICGLPAGIDPRTGLPACVSVEVSASGLNEVFIVRTALSKTESTPRDVEWVLGMRPRGEDHLPPPVHAMIVLERLWAPWREMKKSRDLILQFRTRKGLAKTAGSVSSASSDAIRMGLKGFVRNYVDLVSLPDTSSRALQVGDLIPYRESQGTCIKTHQWRKSVAHFVFNTDNRLVPALSMQFQHISMAMTEQGYLNKNQMLFEAFDSVRTQETATLLYELATGRSLVAGRMGEQLETHMEPIRALIAGLPPSEGWQKVHRFVLDKSMKLWFAPHGKCLPLDPGAMRCHEVAGTTSILNREANYATREPSLCAGCQCFVLDGRHLDFWKLRYVENWASWKRAERAGQTGAFRVIRERANQARALLTKLGVDLTPLTDQAEEQSHAA